jgi:hypothetical protein
MILKQNVPKANPPGKRNPGRKHPDLLRRSTGVPMIEIRCYYCRQKIPLEKFKGAAWYSVNHICLSATAKATRDPKTDEEIRNLRDQVNWQHLIIERLRNSQHVTIDARQLQDEWRQDQALRQVAQDALAHVLAKKRVRRGGHKPIPKKRRPQPHPPPELR